MLVTTAQRTANLTPLDKLAVLAGDIDQLRQRLDGLAVHRSLDDVLEVLHVATLAEHFEVSPETMRLRLLKAGGKVFRMGRKYVIRKVAFLEVIENLESEALL